MGDQKNHILRIIDHPDILRRSSLVLSALKIYFPMDTATHYFIQLQKGSAAEVSFGKSRSDLTILRRGLQAQGFVVEISERQQTAEN